MHSMTLPGAEKLAKTITKFWRKKGERVSVWIEPFGFTRPDGKTATLYSVRSDLIDGRPVRIQLRQAA
jgi:hypothetical protein